MSVNDLQQVLNSPLASDEQKQKALQLAAAEPAAPVATGKVTVAGFHQVYDWEKRTFEDVPSKPITVSSAYAAELRKTSPSDGWAAVSAGAHLIFSRMKLRLGGYDAALVAELNNKFPDETFGPEGSVAA